MFVPSNPVGNYTVQSHSNHIVPTPILYIELRDKFRFNKDDNINKSKAQ